MIKAEWTNKDALDLQPTCDQLTTDCISRQAAIDAVDNFSMHIIEKVHADRGTYVDVAVGRRYTMTKAEVKDLLNGLPPAEKTGHWIQNDNGTWSCDQCQSWIPNEQHYYARFCLYCGAEMKGDQGGII